MHKNETATDHLDSSEPENLPAITFTVPSKLENILVGEAAGRVVREFRTTKTARGAIRPLLVGENRYERKSCFRSYEGRRVQQREKERLFPAFRRRRGRVCAYVAVVTRRFNIDDSFR